MRGRIDERVVTIGGGTGSYTMLSELKRVVNRLWAVVAMTDSGGSSRRLMDQFGHPLPLGDLRQALVALSRSSRLWSDLFRYRFPDAPDGGISGHSLGNLILHALEDLNDGELLGALEDAQDLLDTAGQVLPVTLQQSTLCAYLSDGSVVRGETEIDRPRDRSVAPIERVCLDPPVKVLPEVRKALTRADKILIGPGDLYTSIVPCLLVAGVGDAIQSCDGEVIYICNVMTKRGETDGFRASDFVRVIHHYLGRRVDTVVINTATPSAELAARYADEGAELVVPDLDVLRTMVPQVRADRFAITDPLMRHDAERVVLGIWPELMADPASGAGRTSAD
ncbi:MAG TPA: gluconeogenesis factor YvcK family protein [Thermomicrobiales bacterium]|nr:gluconeogenesis factor YvcK family protein [Thermomicrobiales bacterium]